MTFYAGVEDAYTVLVDAERRSAAYMAHNLAA
jgi:hypothetical protein